MNWREYQLPQPPTSPPASCWPPRPLAGVTVTAGWVAGWAHLWLSSWEPSQCETTASLPALNLFLLRWIDCYWPASVCEDNYKRMFPWEKKKLFLSSSIYYYVNHLSTNQECIVVLCYCCCCKCFLLSLQWLLSSASCPPHPPPKNKRTEGSGDLTRGRGAFSSRIRCLSPE